MLGGSDAEPRHIHRRFASAGRALPRPRFRHLFRFSFRSIVPT